MRCWDRGCQGGQLSSSPDPGWLRGRHDEAEQPEAPDRGHFRVHRVRSADGLRGLRAQKVLEREEEEEAGLKFGFSSILVVLRFFVIKPRSATKFTAVFKGLGFLSILQPFIRRCFYIARNLFT